MHLRMGTHRSIPAIGAICVNLRTVFDFAPNDAPKPDEKAITMHLAPDIDPITALRIYADPRNWDHGAIYTGPGDGPSIAAAALENVA